MEELADVAALGRLVGHALATDGAGLAVLLEAVEAGQKAGALGEVLVPCSG